MSTCRIVLIRHASVGPELRLRGSLDVPLSRDGVEELRRRLARPPSTSPPVALYTSPLQRARAVAIELARRWRLDPHIAEWAREIDCGRLEGVEFDLLRRCYPREWALNEAQTDADFAWPDGESYRQFRARILTGIGVIAAAHPEQRVVVVTHAGVISQVIGAVRGRSPAMWAADRADALSATEIRCEAARPAAVLAFNDPDWY